MLQRTFLCLFLLVLPSIRVTFACRCMQPTAASALNDTTSSIFVGTVLQQKVSIDGEQPQIMSVLSVDRVVKGCSVNTSERIVVTTAGSSASCGVNFQLNETYVVTGEIQKLDTELLFQTYGMKFNIPIKSTVHGSSCSFIMLRGDVSVKDRNTLVHFGNTKNLLLCPCNIGTDCPLPNDYCDSGYCRSNTRPCPPPIRPFRPCLVTTGTCSGSTPCRSGLQCQHELKCNTCRVIYTDANRTRTCYY